jgi:hypothetical protein
VTSKNRPAREAEWQRFSTASEADRHPLGGRSSDQNLASPFIDLIDDQVRTPAGSPKTLKLLMKHVTDPLRILEERSAEELDHRVSGFAGESCQDPLG